MSKESRIIVASESEVSVRSFNDIPDAINSCIEADGLILTEDDLTPDFFNLSSGLAGELFQKCVNYGVRVAIVLPSLEPYGERLRELAHEHRSHPLIRFVHSRDEADAWLQA
jgi:Domain of unknown function (DUF4180)